MSTKNTGGPAFPSSKGIDDNGYAVDATPGMELRDYFAAKAMQGMLASETHGDGMMTGKGTNSTETWFLENAQRAYMMADAMLAAREA